MMHEKYIDELSVFSTWRRSIGIPSCKDVLSKKKPIPYNWGIGGWEGALNNRDQFFSRWIIIHELWDTSRMEFIKQITFADHSVFSIIPEKEWSLDVSIGI